MNRRDFLKKGSTVAGIAASPQILRAVGAAKQNHSVSPIPKRRLGKTGMELSLIGFGGIVVTDVEPAFAANIVAEAFDRGVNYFDVAPSYGNAEERLGPALEPYRQRVFLACKTGRRDRQGAAEELHNSLRTLRTDHFDLYQLHALTQREELDQVLGPNGAMETFQAARQAGKIRLIGFSVHSVETALAAIERFPFDTILFPFNFVLFSQANFGPQVLAKANEKGMGILALKAMAKTTWPKSAEPGHRFAPKCWYQPAALPEEAALGLRWTLSQPVTAAVPPGDEKYFRLAMDVAQKFQPLGEQEQKQLLATAAGVEPIFRLGSA